MILDSSHGRAAAALSPTGAIDHRVDAAHEPALRTLAEVGFVRRHGGAMAGDGWRWQDDGAGDRRLLPLLSAFDLAVEIGPALDDVAWIALAAWQPAAASQAQAQAAEVFVGSGFRPDDAVRSCLGEFAEFRSWLHRPGDSARRCVPAALSDRTLDPWACLGFSSQQRTSRAAFNDTWAGYDSIPDTMSVAGEIDWSAVESMADGSTYWLPTQLCHGRYGTSTWRADSNGCAAGRTPEDATLAAIRELIERDATGIWWYGQCRRPAIDDARLDDHLLTAIGARSDRSQQVHLLDLTHDLGVPVAACTLTDAEGRLRALGFGSKANLGAAAAAAYLEMCQTELAMDFLHQRVERLGVQASADDRRRAAWLAEADLRRLPHLAPDPTAKQVQPHTDQSLQGLIARLGAAHLRAYRLDLQRAEIEIPVLRVFVPGLCHYKPRLGPARLTEVPKRLGWRDAGFGAQDLSEAPLLI